MWIKSLLASLALMGASAASASVVPIWIQGHATGTEAFWSCTPALPCGPVVTPSERDFFYDIGMLDLSSGSANFEIGNASSVGLISGTVLDLGNNNFTGIDFAFAQVSGNPLVCGQVPCQFTVTNLSAPTFAAMLAGVPEPETWLLFLVGFGAIGYALRTRRSQLKLR